MARDRRRRKLITTTAYVVEDQKRFDKNYVEAFGEKKLNVMSEEDRLKARKEKYGKVLEMGIGR